MGTAVFIWKSQHFTWLSSLYSISQEIQFSHIFRIKLPLHILHISSEKVMWSIGLWERIEDIRHVILFNSDNPFLHLVLLWLIQNNTLTNETHSTANGGILVGVKLYSSIGLYWEDANFLHWSMWPIISEKKVELLKDDYFMKKIHILY